jgi:acetate CoA/acetoacetate CoA-transferase alpha subunit
VNKVTSLEAAMARINDGMTIMVGGFMANGTPEAFMDALAERGVKDLTIICNDAGYPDRGVGKLIARGQVKHLIASHIGLNPEAGRLMTDGGMRVDLIPQGTLAERIRSGGSGLGGFLTPTGVGTVVAEGKPVMMMEGRPYLLELPLKADVALLRAHLGDPMGNLVYRRSTRNFNPPMATAAELAIALVDEVVPVGAIDPDNVHTPGIFVDYIVQA